MCRGLSMTKSRWFRSAGRVGSCSRGVVVAACDGGVAAVVWQTPASAQAADDPNPGALHVYRRPRSALGLRLPRVRAGNGSEDHAVSVRRPRRSRSPRATASSRAWSSTSACGTVSTPARRARDGPSGHAHYEEDFYATLNLVFGGGIAVGAGYMALTSPNIMFDTQKELQLKVTKVGQAESVRVSRVGVDTERSGGRRHAARARISSSASVPSFAVGREGAAHGSGEGRA